MAITDDALSQLAPLEARTFAATTTELLRDRILGGVLRPGTRLIEADIAKQLRISRGPVREALATLRAEGLVHEEPRRGVSVSALGAQDIREIYEVRAALESGAARLVIAGGSPEAIPRLTSALERLKRAAGRSDQLDFVEADLLLHEELCRVSGNERLFQAWTSQVGLLRTLIRLETAQGWPSFGPLLEDHDHFVTRILDGDIAGAADACWQLFRRSNAMLSAAALRTTPSSHDDSGAPALSTAPDPTPGPAPRRRG